MNSRYTKSLKKAAVLFVSLCLFTGISFAHEPLYGHGPDVLFKGALNPHLSFQFERYRTENEVAFGYGITRNLTGVVETSFISESGKYNMESFMLKLNYRFYKADKQGLSYKAAFITELELPIMTDEDEMFHCALTAGQEALRFYWFSFIGCKYNLANNSLARGNQADYGIALGMRFNKADYYKPDLVLLLESTGTSYQRSETKNDEPTSAGGNSFKMAPTFIFTYRNWALRGGVQFGVYNSADIENTDTNAKIAIEVHI